MLTIFTIPKPFQGHIDIIQRNAIQSWQKLLPQCEIVLCGNEAGTAEIAHEYAVAYLPELERNEYGTPLLNSAFAQVAEIARNVLLCYVNADILLMNDFIQAVGRVRFPDFLLIGRRWNIEITHCIDMKDPQWESQLMARTRKEGEQASWGAIDYFVFPNSPTFTQLPAFAVGRPGWDNWFIYKARQARFPVIDISQSALVVHQNHGYGHVIGRRGDKWEGPEADQNRRLMGGLEHKFLTLDATHIMTSTKVRPALSLKHLRRRWHTLPVLAPRWRPIVKLFNPLVRVMDRL